MGNKNEFSNLFFWQSTAPFPFASNPNVASGGTNPSATSTQSVSGTNTVYSQIIKTTRFDNIGVEFTWTGTTVGTFSVLVSNSGTNFYPLTFSPAITQPSGTAGGFAVNVNQTPFKYICLQYTNASGTGTINAVGDNRDLN